MKNNSSNSNHEKNGPENLKLLQVPTTPPATPSSPTTPTRGLDDVFKELPITDDTSCGIWCLKGPTLQKFANKKAYVFLYGVLGCIFSASYAYFNGTITTIEKRFKIPSKTTGLITVGNDISQLFVSVALSYYAGRGHRPRWIAFGIYTVVLFCCLTMLPHFLYGPGEDALSLTKEYGAQSTLNTSTILEKHSRKFLCMGKENRGMDCEVEDGNFAPQVLLFIAQLVSGVGGSLYYTLGVSYMDDNIQKSKTPALISFSYFLRMLGPAIGYGLASFSLKFYISPTLTPTITMQDPRWLGAWWLGWIILAILLAIFASIIALFPKTLPRAAARKVLALERNKSAASIKEQESELPASISDMLRTFKRLITNTTLMCNNLATVFYFMGYMPYWIFMPKYIETQYKQSASVSSLITGTVGLVFSAFGILLSGLIISKYKPKARYLAAWNVMIGIISIMGMISYAFLGCSANDNQIAIQPNGVLKTQLPCNEQCHCDYVEYNPVCSDNGQTFISACHAGCRSMKLYSNGSKVYTDCNCVKPKLARSLAYPFSNITSFPFFTEVPLETTEPTVEVLGTAIPGSCPVDCMQKFYIFLTVVCFLKKKDKAVAMGFGLMIMSLFAFIPSPILFGFILDNTCLVWGKTCSGTGNCWLYNGEALRYLLNFTAASFVTIGTVFDVGVWYFVKDVKIFDEEIELEDIAEEPGETL
ncbi:Solute carrier organic anion transporter family member 5A1 [Trachymyrmex zeteki]|uniref:Solute carrier organic anion transporter family member n=1 Tax=Mycetomoellerius zeteki TaxID=64791 RepID=A0A151X5R4_9HYME|nr:PREDICTED: solute carrier organic anion transporter family member 2A1-like [Trachymyrmex zeteki]XP_018303295.1 PREDICTED: solute carrier organic anion transporter family member 2A1-like [Trachymyrmex zeteki]XP_018303296.1 PREDICTED: solute carrier organic anion transporter family member 2A1-like [Trachymyrmex zeteki]KYQ55608.1 Solute carrier organic anion transporter family member 5A1 [Trachymyrmex zeteki]